MATIEIASTNINMTAIPIKILEAAACRRPVVTTTIGAEGLSLINGRHCVIEDDPLKMAQACFRLLNDEKIAKNLVEESFQFIKTNYDVSTVSEKIRDMFR